MCPECFFRISGSAALMTLTGPKKLVSNCSRTRVCVRDDAANSSTVPIRAICRFQHSRFQGKAALSLTFTLATKKNIQPAKCFNSFCNSSLALPHYSVSPDRNQQYSLQSPIESTLGSSHLPSNPTLLHLPSHSFLPLTSSQNSQNSSFLSPLPAIPLLRFMISDSRMPAMIESPCARAWRAMAAPIGVVMQVMSQTREWVWLGNRGGFWVEGTGVMFQKVIMINARRIANQRKHA